MSHVPTVSDEEMFSLLERECNSYFVRNDAVAEFRKIEELFTKWDIRAREHEERFALILEAGMRNNPLVACAMYEFCFVHGLKLKITDEMRSRVAYWFDDEFNNGGGFCSSRMWLNTYKCLSTMDPSCSYSIVITEFSPESRYEHFRWTFKNGRYHIRKVSNEQYDRICEHDEPNCSIYLSSP